MAPGGSSFERRIAVCGALVVGTGAIVYGGFSYDDREALENPVVTGALPLWEAFARDYWHHRGDAGHYRPLATLSLAFDRAVWGTNAFGFHLSNVLLHAAVVALAARFAARLPRPWPIFGLLFFAVHPLLADSVAWISGRTSMLAALGGMVGLVCLDALLRGGRRGRTRGPPARAAWIFLAAAGGLLAGLLGKEDAIIFAPLYLLVVVSRSASGAERARDLLAVSGGVLAGLAAYLSLRAYALGTPLPSAPHAPLASAALLDRLCYGGRALLEAARLLVLPFAYPPSYRAAIGFSPANPPHAWAWLGWLPWLVLVFGGMIVALRARSPRATDERELATRTGRGVRATSAACAALALFPVLGVVPAGEVFAPRFLYLPLLLAVPFAHATLARLPARVAWGALLLLAAVSWARASVYRDRASFAHAVLATVPHDVRAMNDLGLAYEEQDLPDDARKTWTRAVEIDPSYGRPHSNLGRLALSDGDIERAIEHLRRAVALGRRNPIALCNLGAALLRRGRPSDLAEAEQAYARATDLAPGSLAAWRGLGNACLRQSRPDDAQRALERAAALDPSDSLTARLRRRAASGRD